MWKQIIYVQFFISSILAIPFLIDSEVDSEYDYDMTCLCLNGGICALDNDFCICPPEFTGRRCEIKIEKDNSNSCGNLMNGESEYLDCAKCTCRQRILTCHALVSPICDYKKIISIYKLNITLESNDILKLRGEKLEKLVSLMKSTEAYVYESYIHQYRYVHNYGLIVKDLETNTIEMDSFNNDKKFTVYKSKDGLKGIYFNIKSKNSIVNTTIKLSANINLLIIFMIFLYCILFCFSLL